MDSKLVSILVNTMSTEWKKFAYGTGMNLHIIEYIDLTKGNDQVKMQKFLTELVDRNANNFVVLVEKSLKDLGKIQILNEIKTFLAIKQLKIHYIYESYDQANHKQESYDQTNHKQESYDQANHKQEKNDQTDHKQEDSDQTNYKQENNYLTNQKHENNYLTNQKQVNNIFDNHFNLVKDIDLKNNFNEWENFIAKHNTLKTLTFEEFFKLENRLLLISGVAGIGKTYFLKKCLLLWANGLIWENTNFVFYFSLKKLNERMNDYQNISSVSKLIKSFYGNILNIQEISYQWSITMVFDGLDEFIHIKSLIYPELGKSCDIPLVNTLNCVINSSKIKCVLVGRTQAIGTYWGLNKTNENIGNVEIMGFSDLGMKFYFENNDICNTLKNDLNEIAYSSVEAKMLLSVPLYLKAICSSFLNLIISNVKTITDLQMLIFYYFLQQKSISANLSLIDFVHFNKLYILETCKIAYNMIEKGKFSSSENELKTILHNQGLDSIGFIEKSNLSQQYKFTHFILLKFCASVHLYLFENPHTVFDNKMLSMCLPTVCGISYGRKINILNLIINIKEFEEKKAVYKENVFWLQYILEYDNRKLFVRSFFESQASFNDLKISMDVINRLTIDIDGSTDKTNQFCYEEIIAEKYFTDKVQEYNKELEYNNMNVFFKKIVDKIDGSFKEAMFLFDNKQFYNAKKIFTEVENVQIEVFGEKHRDALKTKYWIAMCLYKEEQIDIAEKLFKETENLQKIVLGEKHEETLKSQFWIAMCLFDRHQLDEAEDLLKQIENIRKDNYGEKHEDTLITNYWIGMCFYYKLQLNKAEKLFKEIIIIQKDIFGEKHVITLNTKYGIARCLYDRKEFDQAEKMFREVENAQKEVLGEKHEDTLYTKYWIALCLHDKKEFESSKQILNEVEITRKELLREKSTEALNTQKTEALNTQKTETLNNGVKTQCVLM